MSTLLLLFRTRFATTRCVAPSAPQLVHGRAGAARRSAAASSPPGRSRAAAARLLLDQPAQRARRVLVRQDLARRSAPKPQGRRLSASSSTSREGAYAPRLGARRRPLLPLLLRRHGGPPSSAGASAGASTIGGGGSSARPRARRARVEEPLAVRRGRGRGPSSLSAGGARRARGCRAPPRGAAARSAAAFFRSFALLRGLGAELLLLRRAASPRGVDAGVPHTVAGVVGVASSSLHDVDGAAGFGALGGEGRASRSLGATRNRARRARRPAGGHDQIRIHGAGLALP